MKVIEILNKIANGEEVPHFIIDEQDYYVGADGFLKGFLGDDAEWTLDRKWLNEEVEIIEEDKKENEIPNINLDNMKDIGAKVGKAYRELFEGFNKGWNTPLEEEKKIPEKLSDILRVDDLIPPVDENMYKIWTQIIKNQNKINEILDYLKSKGDE